MGKNTKSALFLDLIGRLFEIESEIHGKTAAERLAARREKSFPIVIEIKKLAETLQKEISRKTLTGKAIIYMENLWDTLTVLLKVESLKLTTILLKTQFAILCVLSHYAPLLQISGNIGSCACADG